MPCKTRHTKAVPPPPPEIKGFLAEVGEVLREQLAEKRGGGSGAVPKDAHEGANDDESGGILPSE